MRARRIERLACCLFISTMAMGCQTLSGDRPLAVEVIDAESKKPITNAQVKLTYPMAQSGVSLQESTTPVSGDGIARIKVSSTSDYGVILAASADGYLSTDLTISNDSVRHLSAAGVFDRGDHRAPNYRLELYAGPDFSIELAVPTGYRGLIRAKPKFEDQFTFRAGLRHFQFNVSSNGQVELAGPAVLRHILPVDYSATFADGTAIAKNADETIVGIKYWKMEGADQLFVVGTKSEIEGFVRTNTPDPTDAPRSSGGRGSGPGGGGHHRGGGGGGNGGNAPGAGSSAPPW